MGQEVTRLNVDVDGTIFCSQFDVTFRGVKQTNCLIADSKIGYIKRYRYLFGVLARDRAGRPMIEELRGPVTIERRKSSNNKSN